MTLDQINTVAAIAPLGDTFAEELTAYSTAELADGLQNWLATATRTDLCVIDPERARELADAAETEQAIINE